MAHIRSYFEITPEELRSKPALRRFLPCREQAVRFSWFKWFWLGHCVDSKHTILVGPFKTRWGARRAWARVPTTVEIDLGGRRPTVVKAVDLESPGAHYQMNKSFSDYHRTPPQNSRELEAEIRAHLDKDDATYGRNG